MSQSLKEVPGRMSFCLEYRVGQKKEHSDSFCRFLYANLRFYALGNRKLLLVSSAVTGHRGVLQSGCSWVGNHWARGMRGRGTGWIVGSTLLERQWQEWKGVGGRECRWHRKSNICLLKGRSQTVSSLQVSMAWSIWERKVGQGLCRDRDLQVIKDTRCASWQKSRANN